MDRTGATIVLANPGHTMFIIREYSRRMYDEYE